mmetsp:Transcript_16605/g.36187  ORF Transcript_16605/g.36187 Transcript_16605/m.36187 type:complete len:90 (-) Transcript_16605:2499-2768(-)
MGSKNVKKPHGQPPAAVDDALAGGEIVCLSTGLAPTELGQRFVGVEQRSVVQCGAVHGNEYCSKASNLLHNNKSSTATQHRTTTAHIIL